MNFLLDNNLPPSFAKAIHTLSQKYGHKVVHLSDKFSRDTTDIEWVSTLKEAGGWVIISQDQFRKSDLEKKAFRECGLVVFCLAKQWGGISRTLAVCGSRKISANQAVVKFTFSVTFTKPTT
ncbi:hypothetical protein Y5W_01249 [Alcanivorax sp. 521-1]|uniref:VapC45 PIN like domain-containing protein n=1 Tax=Alloalcanivorax profundimaris TaxID=2735259 RepID=A0ABS0AP94_9GAMM|nr:hypothetical protein [Alloalcanivorax profundimaris]MBF5055955.1 hypothetical protein [Alloalcanivorax profundimaris]